MLTVYLAGGMHTAWQAKVILACQGLQFLDPCGKPKLEFEEYSTWDLHAIKMSDIVFGYMEKTNPGGTGMAVEIGYAKGLGKTVILVLEPGNEFQKDRYLQFMKKAADICYDNLESGIGFLKIFESMA